MVEVTLSISKSGIIQVVESLAWKYAVAKDNGNNVKQTNNTKADGAGRAVDNTILSDSFSKRFNDVVDLVRDFLYSVTGTDPKVITIAVSGRWGGDQNALTDAVKDYITNGMMADWLNATANGDAQAYASLREGNRSAITNMVYSLKKPQ